MLFVNFFVHTHNHACTVPGPVRNLQAGGLNERSLAVVWEEPAVTNGVVSYHYSLHSDSIPGHSLQLTTNCTVVHIGNLCK